jgi:hypothetical protein
MIRRKATKKSINLDSPTIKEELVGGSYCFKTILCEKDSYRITLKFIEEFVSECLKSSKVPMLRIAFKNLDTKKTYIINCNVEIK